MPRPTRFFTKRASVVVLLSAAVIVPLPLRSEIAAQTLTLKRDLGAAGGSACVLEQREAPPRSNATQRQEASRLASAATQSAILGDLENARSQLERAAQLNPRSASIAYQLAGVLESVGEAQTAVEEYCRYLYLSPTAPDTPEIEERIRTLSPLSGSRVSDEARGSFEVGVASFASGDYDGAILAFDQVILREPTWVDAYYNRALAQLSRRRIEPAVRDLEQYIGLASGAPDETAVAVTVVNLRNRMTRYTPSFAFMASQVFPGMGQFYLGRPISGAMYATLGVGPVVFGFFYDSETKRRPYFWDSVAVGLGVGFVAAVDAVISARRRNSSIDDLVRISVGNASVGLRPPGLVPSSTGGLSLALLRLQF